MSAGKKVCITALPQGRAVAYYDPHVADRPPQHFHPEGVLCSPQTVAAPTELSCRGQRDPWSQGSAPSLGLCQSKLGTPPELPLAYLDSF